MWACSVLYQIYKKRSGSGRCERKTQHKLSESTSNPHKNVALCVTVCDCVFSGQKGCDISVFTPSVRSWLHECNKSEPVKVEFCFISKRGRNILFSQFTYDIFYSLETLNKSTARSKD